jgi:hypothetical protein
MLPEFTFVVSYRVNLSALPIATKHYQDKEKLQSDHRKRDRRPSFSCELQDIFRRSHKDVCIPTKGKPGAKTETAIEPSEKVSKKNMASVRERNESLTRIHHSWFPSLHIRRIKAVKARLRSHAAKKQNCSTDRQPKPLVGFVTDIQQAAAVAVVIGMSASPAKIFFCFLGRLD